MNENSHPAGKFKLREFSRSLILKVQVPGSVAPRPWCHLAATLRTPNYKNFIVAAAIADSVIRTVSKIISNGCKLCHCQSIQLRAACRIACSIIASAIINLCILRWAMVILAAAAAPRSARCGESHCDIDLSGIGRAAAVAAAAACMRYIVSKKHYYMCALGPIIIYKLPLLQCGAASPLCARMKMKFTL